MPILQGYNSLSPQEDPINYDSPTEAGFHRPSIKGKSAPAYLNLQLDKGRQAIDARCVYVLTSDGHYKALPKVRTSITLHRSIPTSPKSIYHTEYHQS